jgi:hypothetical protein
LYIFLIGIIAAFQANPPTVSTPACGSRVAASLDSTKQHEISVTYTTTITVVSFLKKIVVGVRLNLKIKQKIGIFQSLPLQGKV